MVDSDPRSTEQPEEIPLGQRLLENWVFLLVSCLVVFFIFYTGWGLVEIATLTDAPLP
jgi:hypothetical protein